MSKFKIGDKVNLTRSFDPKVLNEFGEITEVLSEELFRVVFSNGIIFLASPYEMDLDLGYVIFFTEYGGDMVFVAKDKEDLMQWLDSHMESVKVKSVHKIGEQVEIVETRTYSLR